MSSPASGEPADADWLLGISQRDIDAAEADLAAPDDEGYVCHPCQSGKHLSCREWACTCCSGGDED